MANYANAAALKSSDFAPSNTAPSKTTSAQPRNSVPVLVQRETAQALPNKHATNQPVYRQGLLGRLIAKVIIARQYAAEREVARYLATTGGKMTDSIEREIQRRVI